VVGDVVACRFRFSHLDLLKIARQAQSGFYIGRLSTLVSSRKQNYHFTPDPFEVHPVTRSVVDPQFGNSLAYRLDVSGVFRREALDPYLHSRPRSDIAQPVKPAGEDVGLADLKHEVV
jgi:hypothetical protein